MRLSKTVSYPGIAILLLASVFLGRGLSGDAWAESLEDVLLVSSQSDASGAEVFVNGDYAGMMSSTGDAGHEDYGPHIRLRLVPGRHTFKVIKPGYRLFEQTYRIEQRFAEPGLTVGDYLIPVQISRR